MTVPSEVTIGPHTYTVDATAETGKLLHEENSRGDSRPDRLLIRIDPDRPHTAVAETLLHELLHCCWNQTSLRTSEACQDVEEAAVSALAPLVLDLLRRNPEVVRFVTGGAA